MNKKEEFLKIMDFRHACKLFDETKKISDEDMHYILEVARKSPSSFGMEAWKFLVITNDELREKLRPFPRSHRPRWECIYQFNKQNKFHIIQKLKYQF